MTVSSTMSLSELAERMGDTATEAEARTMRDQLTQNHDGQNTRDIPESEWLEMLDRTAEQ